ncbi:hypothetical protein, partial [Klebsiella aerogenes]|uniref:hypothetical protein n=1 Tax=Klebsiella aerogenes TaxID=548 RepID=UPI001953B0BD
MAIRRDRSALASERFAYNLNAARTGEWINQDPLLELGLGFARGVKILSKVEVLLFRNPSADPASVRS